MEGDQNQEDRIVCHKVNSIRGEAKLKVGGYLFTKERNRGDLYYWCCEYKGKKSVFPDCKGRASTILVGGQHMLRSSAEHSHAPEASKFSTLQNMVDMKLQASRSNDFPAQIIQNTVSRCSREVTASLPSKDALRQQIKRVRREVLPAEPDNLLVLALPDQPKRTLSGNIFLLWDSIVANDRILLFSTVENLRILSNAEFWLMDGTFKTVPTLFTQLYTIHCKVGAGMNSRILPMVFALMSRKTQDCYTRLFHDLHDLFEENEFHVQLEFILTDFEKAAINASREEFPGAQSKGCFFHLAQNVYRRIQCCGLQVQYGGDAEFSLLLRQIPALAFLSPYEIPEAFDHLKARLPASCDDIVKWFEETYVHGRVRRVLRDGAVNRAPPLFEPRMWSVLENAEVSMPRTQNNVEAWHRKWEILVGRPHVGIHKIVQEIQKEQQQVENTVEDILRGRPGPAPRRKVKDRELRIQNILNDRRNRSTTEFLRAIAHNISL